MHPKVPGQSSGKNGGADYLPRSEPTSRRCPCLRWFGNWGGGAGGGITP